ncbi:hypothetical protein [Paenibacillus protaetiae]|uniref:Uncharacterized protein n=1 Tax=Paenibacillus protaetiae TaxID=2509456 RepID=A0A4P6ER48_9BACL|nr:hypothetical protein [Paenibacillus protaetiae]QAY65334.1 hypothetical protein ET464_02005 [Paenibacillus protaetiae]
MSLSKRYRFTVMLLLLLLGTVSAPFNWTTYAAPDNTGSIPTEVEQSAKEWIAAIAKQPEFASWKNASYSINPLGPGTHGWLVIVRKDNGSVGYLVVNAVANNNVQQYQLGEYGLGRPPFDASMLELALKRLELIPSSAAVQDQIYVHPLMAAWKLDGKYADAFSGEGLPVDSQTWAAAQSEEQQRWSELLFQLPAIGLADITDSAANSSFNPYYTLPWLLGQPLPDTGEDKLKMLLKEHKQLIYTSESFDQAYRYVWAVTGYQQWANQTVYAALEAAEADGSKRYIPLQLLHELGGFYL